MTNLKEYSGVFTYSGLENAAIVKSFMLLPHERLLIELTEKREAYTVRFLGIAEKNNSLDWRTPWVYLATSSGGDLCESDEEICRIIVDAVEMVGLSIRVVGSWVDSDNARYDFNGILNPV